MKRVPAEEFAANAAEYLAGAEPVSVEKDGAVIGQYLPTPNGHAENGVASDDRRGKNKAELRAHFEQLRDVLQEIYAETGMTEDEFADLFDTKKPAPYGLRPRP